MLVVTLGTPASGSTWVFNVVRSIFRHARPSAVSFSSAEAVETLDSIKPGTRDLILKAHQLDQRLLSLISLVNSKIIITDRDPLDSVVSQSERFSLSVRLAMVDLTRSFSTIAMLDTDENCLRLRYEDEFTHTLATVSVLADFLGLPISPEQARAVFEDHRPDKIKNKIGEWLNMLRHLTPTHNPVTHWHPNHLGDGRVGKWRERLAPDTAEAVFRCLGPLHERDGWKQAPIIWSSQLFTFPDDRESCGPEELFCDGSEQVLVYGPYLHLPAGRWRIDPLVSISPGSAPLAVKVDVFIPVEGRGLIQLRTMLLTTAGSDRHEMEFNHVDHMEAVEIRIWSTNDGRTGRLVFSGMRLHWLGALNIRDTRAAVPVTLDVKA